MKQTIGRVARKSGYLFASAWLAFHVFTVFISPAKMAPVSPLLWNGYQVTVPYAELFFLDHGYHFFAPDPGASTLISYTVTREGDSPIVGQFPDTSIRPRLLYHRYFMLAENVSAFPEETQTEVYRAYARHFANLHGSTSIELNRVLHEPSSISRILAGGTLADRTTFSEEPIESYQFGPPVTTSAASGF